MEVKNVFYYNTDIGKIGIAEKENKITDLFFSNRELKCDTREFETELIKKTISEVREYLIGKRSSFDIPINPSGTEFYLSVWKEVMNIPYGETRSYKQIANKVGNSRAFRAVGMALNKNPIAIIIPCHRVIGTSGKIIGYAGGVDIKELLLKLESEN